MLLFGFGFYFAGLLFLVVGYYGWAFEILGLGCREQPPLETDRIIFWTQGGQGSAVDDFHAVVGEDLLVVVVGDVIIINTQRLLRPHRLQIIQSDGWLGQAFVRKAIVCAVFAIIFLIILFSYRLLLHLARLCQVIAFANLRIFHFETVRFLLLISPQNLSFIPMIRFLKSPLARVPKVSPFF